MTDVTQEDREAADRLEEMEWPGNHAAWTAIIAEAFAAHRQATASSLAAENERLRAGLERIRDMCPVTCEMTIAHEMAAEADAALQGE